MTGMFYLRSPTRLIKTAIGSGTAATRCSSFIWKPDKLKEYSLGFRKVTECDRPVMGVVDVLNERIISTMRDAAFSAGMEKLVGPVRSGSMVRIETLV